MKAFVLEVYLYIGITPLCLYITSAEQFFQDGKFHKILPAFSCRWEKTEFFRKKYLTLKGIMWYAVLVGVAFGRPFFPINFLAKTVENRYRI